MKTNDKAEDLKMLNEWKHADRNMQYRVVNALIKENIWTHSTTIFKENHYITIEFEQVLLNVHYKYESALSRYEFDGPIIYMLSLIHISEPTRHFKRSRMPSSA